MLLPFRACSSFLVRSADDDARVIEGIATSTSTDGAGDVIESAGAVYKLPMPLLMQHDRREPVGQVTAAKVSANEITIRAEISRDSGLDYVERAWRQLKAGLVKGLSIGAQPLKAEPILDARGRMTGVRYTAWRWLELSAVTVPMNLDSTIEVVRSFDPWGAALYSAPRDLVENEGPEPEDHTYQATRARIIAALNVSARALHRA
jgi:HK97 family phage prohead protease